MDKAKGGGRLVLDKLQKRINARANRDKRFSPKARARKFDPRSRPSRVFTFASDDNEILDVIIHHTYRSMVAYYAC